MVSRTVVVTVVMLWLLPHLPGASLVVRLMVVMAVKEPLREPTPVVVVAVVVQVIGAEAVARPRAPVALLVEVLAVVAAVVM